MEFAVIPGDDCTFLTDDLQFCNNAYLTRRYTAPSPIGLRKGQKLLKFDRILKKANLMVKIMTKSEFLNY